MSSETQTLFSRTFILKQKILELGKMKGRKLQVICCVDESFKTKLYVCYIFILCSPPSNFGSIKSLIVLVPPCCKNLKHQEMYVGIFQMEEAY